MNSGFRKQEARPGVALLAALGLALAFAPGAAAQAKGPTFDCAKAQGEVEKLVCKDAKLGELDRKLDTVYKAATAKAKGAPAKTLVAEQRGWVKGRNDCWKAQAASPEFITASWQAASARDCADAQYRLRITELQAVWGLVPAKGPTSYVCQNNPANEVVATFYQSELPSARLERGDQSVTVYQVPVASLNGKYEGRNVSLTPKGSEIVVWWLNTNTGEEENLSCKPR